MRAHVKAETPAWPVEATTWWGWAYKVKGDDRLVLCVYPSREVAERYTPKHATTHRALIPIVIDHSELKPVDPEENPS